MFFSRACAEEFCRIFSGMNVYAHAKKIVAINWLILVSNAIIAHTCNIQYII